MPICFHRPYFFLQIVPTMTTRRLKLVTWNTCGVRDTAEVPDKHIKIRKTLDELGASVAFLQETHIGPKSVEHVNDIWVWKSFFSVHHPRSKGVAILIKKGLRFEYINEDVDPTGSYIVLICKLLGKCFTLVNVYNHIKEPKVLQRLSEYLCQTAKGVLIVAGDFNTIVNTDLDREHQTGHTEPLRPYLEEFISSLMLVEIWGSLHPDSFNSFTRFPWEPSGKQISTEAETSKKQKTIKSASRLDMVLMPRTTMQLIKSCEIHKIRDSPISDHHPVVLSLRLPKSHDTEAVSSTDQTASRSDSSVRKGGEICEAEVLKALMSIVEYETPLGKKLENFKSNKEQKSKELKARFNQMIRKTIPKSFTDSVESKGWHIFTVEYMILATIFARRVEKFLQPSFKTKTIKKNDKLFVIVCFSEKPKKIKGHFLRQALSSLKGIHPSPPRDFKIVENMLPSIDGRYKQLREGCPLTPTLLTLSLKHLAKKLKVDLKDSVVDVCHHRKCITIYMDPNQHRTLKQSIHKFQRESGISLLPKEQKSRKKAPKTACVE